MSDETLEEEQRSLKLQTTVSPQARLRQPANLGADVMRYLSLDTAFRSLMREKKVGTVTD